jgi:hypothetical protein
VVVVVVVVVVVIMAIENMVCPFVNNWPYGLSVGASQMAFVQPQLLIFLRRPSWR